VHRTTTLQVYYPVPRLPGERVSDADADKLGCVNQHGLNRKNIFGSVQQSLKRLQFDYVDVLHCSSFAGLVTVLSTALTRF
jgi:aryl-alcohol dehydrogenase-like predicted oxidoreductase